MNNKSNSYIICPKCQRTTILSYDGLYFLSQCHSNHINKSNCINNFLSEIVNDEEFNCSEHGKNGYIQYCKKCNKNICSECYENHEDHEEDLLYFPKIKIKKKEYEEYSLKLKTMQMHKDLTEKIFNKISKLKETINELNKNINEIYIKTEKFNNKLKNQYSFNKAIFDSYNINKLNYNTITNIKNFNFKENDFNDFKKSIDMENVIKLIKDINEMSKEDIPLDLLILDNSINTFISLNYCQDWGISEAIREIIQNQFDEIVTQIEGKDKLIVENTGEEVELFDEFTNSKIKTKLNYIFKKKDSSEIYGEIKYDKNKKEIKISNIGKLETGDLLFGCKKNIENRKDIIGRFGEGMKLAALAFSRLNKKFVIKSNGKIWTFFQRKDNKFIKKKEVLTCLFWKEDLELEYNENNSNNYVEIIISDFSPEEWLKETDKYLWLNRRETGKIVAYSDDEFSPKEVIGEILLGDYFKRKLYVKDSYVETTNDSSDCSLYFGFNLDLELDRDRKCVINIFERNQSIRKIIAYILNNFQNIRKSLSGKDLNLLNIFIEGVYQCLENDYQTTYDLHYNITIEGADYLWDYMEKKNKSYKNKYPIYFSNSVKTFISEKNLPKDFYPYFQVSYPLSKILQKRKNFVTIESKYDNYFKKVEIEENLTVQYKDSIEEIRLILNKLTNNKNLDIKFKHFNDTDEQARNTYYIDEEENVIYFSNKLLLEPINKEWKSLILGNCVEMLTIPYQEIILLSNLFN